MGNSLTISSSSWETRQIDENRLVMAPKQSLTIEQTADVLGWSPVQVRRSIKAGLLRAGPDKGSILWEDVRELAYSTRRAASWFSEDVLRSDEVPSVFLRNGNPASP